MATGRKQAGLLVLGASGKIGRMLRRHWSAAGAPDHPGQVVWQYRETPGTAPDRDPPPQATRDTLVWAPGAAVPRGLGPIGTVLALWGVTPARDGAAALSLNTNLALAAQELAAALGAGLVLHCSSAAVYEPCARPEGGAWCEPRAGGRINAYGAAKLAMEQALADWAARHPGGPRALSLRLANVVGADSLFAAIGAGADHVTLDRFDDGEGPWRSYLTLPDLAHVAGRLAAAQRTAALPRVLNVAAPRPVAMEALARAAGCRVDWRPAPAGAARMVALDTAALQHIAPLPDRSAEDMVASWRALTGGSA